MLNQERLDKLLARFDVLEQEMAQGPDPVQYVKLAKEYADLGPVVEAVREMRACAREQDDLHEILQDDEADDEMKTLALEEMAEQEKSLEASQQKIRLLLLPRDKADDKSAILEVRAGTGGDEAALFAGDLFRMYQRFADLRGWKVEIISASEADMGGYKEIIAGITGKGVFAKLKFESGVHRVQRVPETESSGRIHTSAATVAVLPEAEDVDIEIEDKDLRVDVFRASGPGGQSVNTTDSAVRITHLPSGLVVTQQDEKSQHKNRAKAMKVLRARLYEAERQKQDDKRAADRRGQVGTGDRSERIRTYNFPQGRVSDHRINLTLHKLTQILEGEGLGEVIEALITEDQARKLANVGEDA